ERVNDPFILCIGGTDAATFLTQKTVVGVGAAQGVDDFLFGYAVNLADEVIATFLFDSYQVHALKGLFDQFAGFTGGAQRHIQHGFHGLTLLKYAASTYAT